MNPKIKMALVIFASLLLLLLIRWWFSSNDVTGVIQGQVEAREFIVSSKIPGRIGSIVVKKGQQVLAHDLIFTIASPEIEAKLRVAKAGRDSVGALARQAENGARKQEKSIAKEEWQKAKIAQELFFNTYKRMQALYDSGVVSLQHRDEAHAQWQASKLTTSSAAELNDLAQEGARAEVIDAARAQLSMAEAAVDEVSVFQADTQVFSWISGEVSDVIMSPGEIVPPGFPVVTIIDMDQAFAIIAVREDQLSKFKMDSVAYGSIPALNVNDIEFKVTNIAVMANFATWRATDDRQGYDMRTFEVELEPVEPIKHLRAGMSVLIELSDRESSDENNQASIQTSTNANIETTVETNINESVETIVEISGGAQE